MEKKINFLITGVGGQGTILASDILAEVGMRLGYNVKKSDILGLAIRGGSVLSHVIFGEQVHAPMISQGQATYYISFEWLEGLRRLSYVNKDTIILANDWMIDPALVSSGQAEYPSMEVIMQTMQSYCKEVHTIAATKKAIEIGNARVFNSIMMGALSNLVGGDAEIWRSAILEKAPSKAREINEKAFEIGCGNI